MDRIWGGGIVSKIGVVMGSTSDLPVVEKAIHILEEYQVPFEVRVLSAHRCPNEAREFAASARESGFSVLIAAAGGASGRGAGGEYNPAGHWHSVQRRQF